ncbi:MAG: SDR family NAD(P)-dependent oxidoreductase [Gemmatimonadales bacterium]|nr:MAG: SDR family NAD(P)-dependent oxidoreductase [Gemmatimonadales bacterium]
MALPTYPFQRSRYWVDVPARQVSDAGPLVHPLLGRRLESPFLEDTVFESRLGTAFPSFLNDHRIHGVPLVPATGFLEMGLAAAVEAWGPGAHALEEVSVRKALVLAEQGERRVQVALREEEGRVRFQVYGLADPGAGRWELHASGRVRRADGGGEAPGRHSLEESRNRCRRSIDPAEYYAGLLDAGVKYGPAFRRLTEILGGDGEALARVEASEGAESDLGQYLVHPPLLDACIQLLGATLPGSERPDPDGRVYVPVTIGSYRVHRPGPRAVWCRAILTDGSRGTDSLRGDLELCDEGGVLLAEVRGIELQKVHRDVIRRLARDSRLSAAEGDESLYTIRWALAPLPTGAVQSSVPDEPGRWLLLADEGGVGERLARTLESRGHRCHLVQPGANEEAERAEVASRLAEARDAGDLPFRGAVHLRALDAEQDPSLVTLNASARATCGSALALVRAAARSGMKDAVTYFVTRGGQAAAGATAEHAGDLAVAQAPLWGLGRTVQLEHPELNARCLDLDPASGGSDPVETILGELAAADGEDQILWRGGRRFAARLGAYEPDTLPIPLPRDRPFEVAVTRRGTLDNLEARPTDRRPPGPGEVEVRVVASGLNFRDVLNVLGMYPGDPGPIGSECAGVITAVGEGVGNFEVGDEVVAMGPGAFRSFLTVPVAAVHRKPERLSFVEAATVPITFLTAWYGLHHLAGIREGDRVLVHAAAGGVGLAAVQIALRAGAEVFGTAGTSEKRSFLRSFGVHHALNSRTLDFAGEIPKLTGGRGVDIVLNSLADDFIPRSLEVLADGGRFLEIGKRGVWTAERVAEFNPTLDYHLYDLGEALQKDPGLSAAMFERIMPEFEANRFQPLPQRTFPVERIRDAFRFMAQARHIGKIVITCGDRAGELPVRGDGTYLVTGGLGGVGLLVASRLVERGARHLVLMGRSPPSPEAARTLEKLRESGARVEVLQGDVADPGDVDRVFEAIEASLPPLCGVLHLAGVVDDAMLLRQSPDLFDQVGRPKIAGSWNLHSATRGHSLDFFVLFSTGSAVLGSAGQGNYAAANAFLDALAHRRRAEGLPALSVNWGGWEEVGMVARMKEQDLARWNASGVGLIDPDQGWACLGRLVADGAVQAAVLPFDWPLFLRAPEVRSRPIFRSLVEKHEQARGVGKGEEGATRSRFLADLEAADPLERREVILEHVRSRVASVLGLDPGTPLDPKRGLAEIGMDSLMAVELSNHLERSLDRKLPPTLAFEYPTIAALADFLAGEVLSPAGADAESPAGGAGTGGGAGAASPRDAADGPGSALAPAHPPTGNGPTNPDPPTLEEAAGELLEELRRAGY